MEQGFNKLEKVANLLDNNQASDNLLSSGNGLTTVIQVELDDPLGLNRIHHSPFDPSRPRPRSGNSGAQGGDSPESASLYSDEIPSGYNSGEQYDTLSTGYMSGEAYELPETRMELHEPALDPIDECSNSMGGDDNLFLNLGDGGGNEEKRSTMSITSTSSSEAGAMVQDGGGRVEATVLHHLPSGKTKLRKKVTTFANPPVDNSGINLEAYESSDACVGVSRPSGGYRAVPSDTDTSAMDSDANAAMTDGGNDSSGTELLRAATHCQLRPGQKGYKKNLMNHDENWFNSKDSKCWSALRVICFWATIIGMLTSIVTAGILIYLMPRACAPERSWYQGHVMMDIHPDSQTDLLDLTTKIPYFASLGIKALHLKDKMVKNSSGLVFSEIFRPTSEVISTFQAAFDNSKPFSPGNFTLLKRFADDLHSHNMSLMVQIPVFEPDSDFNNHIISMTLKHETEQAIKYLSQQGVDGISLVGMEHFGSDIYVGEAIKSWHDSLERYSGDNKVEKVLMTSYMFAHELTEKNNPKLLQALEFIRLLDATLDLGEMDRLNETTQEVENMAKWDASNNQPWINWNLKYPKNVEISNAAAAFQMFLPGTININSLDKIDLQSDQLLNMTALRSDAVPIYMNGNYKRCNCPEGLSKETNYIMHHPIKNVIQLERFYSRRNRFVLVANFGQNSETLSVIGKIYTGGEIVLDTSQTVAELNSQVLFKELTLAPGQALVIKIPK